MAARFASTSGSTRTAHRILATQLLKCRPLSQVSNLKKTVLHDFHLQHGGKMVDYAGWSMPVQYSDLSIINSCIHTRKMASLFDVSHMLQSTVTGSDAEEFLEATLVADIKSLPLNRGTLSVITNSEGGIIDDCIVTRTGPKSFYLVTNAGREDVDMQHMNTQKERFSEVHISPMLDRALLALQGPRAATVLQQGVNGDLDQLKFMTSTELDVFGVPNCRVSRCGYTGEDGFEISIPSSSAVELAEKFLSINGEDPPVKLAALGARDVLRLEAGLCLYGNDLTEETTPIEAGLAWCISKRRRSEGGFLGADKILRQLKEKPSRRRVGIRSDTGPPARHGSDITNKDGEIIGTVSSGTKSPILNYNISMAYVPLRLSKVGTELSLRIRRHHVPGTVVKMPFVATNYFT